MRQRGVGNCAHDYWVAKHLLGHELTHLKALNLVDLVEKHILCQPAGVRQAQNVGVGPHSEGLGVSTRVRGKTGRADANVLTFPEPAVLDVEDLRVPDLAAFVNGPHFTLVLVDFK